MLLFLLSMCLFLATFYPARRSSGPSKAGGRAGLDWSHQAPLSWGTQRQGASWLGPAPGALESGHRGSPLPASKSRHRWGESPCRGVVGDGPQGRRPRRGGTQGIGGHPLSVPALFLDLLGGAVHRGSPGRAHLRLHPGPTQQRPHGPCEGVDQRPGGGVRPGRR